MAKKTTPTKPPKKVTINKSAGLELMLMIAFIFGWSILVCMFLI